MCVVKPIPLHLLRDSVIYEEFEGKDRWEESWKAPISLRNVRVQEMSSLAISNVREHSEYKLLLFFDVVNSKADAPFTFVEKSKVTYKGNVYEVNKVITAQAFKLHHYELELC